MQIFKRIKLLLTDKNIKKIVLIFIVTRLLLLGVGYYAHYVLPNSPRMYDYDHELEYFGNIGTMFHGWDSGWYLKIAENGYTEPNRMAFYPLYPLIIKLLGQGIGNVNAGLFI